LSILNKNIISYFIFIMINKTTSMMTVQEIADRLVGLCRSGRHDQAYQELFAKHASGHEMPQYPDSVTEGLDALLAKSAAWAENMGTILSMEVTDPLVYASHFAVGMGMEVEKADGTRSHEQEMCVYTVEDGKIISERFIYLVPGQ
jgi:uncharacterized protein with von Willebrand factor type A (vWA) domain